MLAPLFKYNFHCTGLHFMELYFNLLWHCLSLQLFHCADISIEIPNVFAIRTRHDIAEILLKLALITNQSINQSFGNKDFCLIFYIFLEIDIKCNTHTPVYNLNNIFKILQAVLWTLLFIK